MISELKNMSISEASPSVKQLENNTTSTPVGQLYCQRNSLAKSLKTSVVECVAVTDGKYEVVLKDTVIFPTGGGQPNDTGVIEVCDGTAVANVLDCQRRGLTAVHIVDKEIKQGSLVEVRVDWNRRWDQMQQHSGQHVISDIAEERKWMTFGWNMGKEKSFVEFEKVALSQEDVDDLEAKVNAFIVEGHPMHLEESHITQEDRPDSLPTDIQSGVVRNIRFGPYAGPCCGTHVTSSSSIQMVKFLNIEKVRGGNCRVWFVAGNRVLETLSRCLQVEKELNVILSSAPQDFPARVSKKMAQIKELTKENKNLSKELKSLSNSSPAAPMSS